MTWNGGHPAQDRPGTCWCNHAMQQQAQPYCMCTPSLAIDLVIVTNDDDPPTPSSASVASNSSSSTTGTSIWIVKRKDTNQWATMGGFVQVGETVEAAVARELLEETGIDITTTSPFASEETNNNNHHQQQHSDNIVLFGVYSDPRRDNRRHTVSIAYAIHLNSNHRPPVAADDVKQVMKIPINDIEKYEFFADHQTILLDYRKILSSSLSHKPQQRHVDALPVQSSTTAARITTTDVVRSLCPARG